MSDLNHPCGQNLVDLMLPEANAREYLQQRLDLPSWYCNARQLCDLECLCNGAFSPLTGFMSQKDYESVLSNMQIATGQCWSIPITLDVSNEFADQIAVGSEIALRDGEGFLLAVLNVSDLWQPDKRHEAMLVYGTEDIAHPGVDYLLTNTGNVYVGGELKGIARPKHFDFSQYRLTPAQLRDHMQQLGWKTVVGFQTRNPMHRAHVELTKHAASSIDANLLIQPVVGRTKPGDVDHYTRVHCYEKVIKHYESNAVLLNLLPLAMRMAGPREALWHAIIRKNYGCSHFIVGRDHAGPGNNTQGEPFYHPYAAQELVAEHEAEIGIGLIPMPEMVYVEQRQTYCTVNELNSDETVLTISGTELRRRLRADEPVPEWFSYPEVLDELRLRYPARHKHGFTIFFTGLSGAGKSTLAKALMVKLMETEKRGVTLLDGDIVRQHLSSELGFSKEHRNLNIQRIGFVASEITKHGGIAICAPIAPYQAVRREVRKLVSEHGGFVEVYISTPLDECERRDPKGLYAKARAGKLKQFTGIDDPYEKPEDAEIVIDTSGKKRDQTIDYLLQQLTDLGYLR